MSEPKALKDYTTSELLSELSQRKSDKQKRPKLNSDINWMTVIEYVAWVCEEIEQGRVPPDFQHYIFENVLEAMYGPYVWAWYLKVVDGRLTPWEISEVSKRLTR